MAEQDMQRIGMTEDDLAMQESRAKRSDQAAAFASWLNSMRMKPDANLPAQLQAAQERRASNIRKNRTVNMLESAGQTELAKQVKSGAITGKTAVAQMFQLAAEERQAQRAAAARAASSAASERAATLAFERQKELIGLRQSAAGQQLSSEEKLVNLYKNAYPDKTNAEILEMAMAGDNKAPAAFQALKMQALAAGLEEGSEAYKNFMLTRGAGPETAAKLEAKQVVQAPATVQKAQSAIDAIDGILGNNNLAGITGKYEGQLGTTGIGSAYFSQSEIDLIKDLENLEAKVFLEAFETLKGGGQITEREGIQAQRAMENLSRQQSPQQLQKNLRDLKDIILKGQERARNKIQVPEADRYTGSLGTNVSTDATATQQGGAMQTDASGRKYRLVDRGNGVMEKVYE
jgi:hypothetical protein